MSDIKLRGLGSSSGGLTSRDRPTLDQSAQHLAAIVEMARSRRGSSTRRSSRASTTISLHVASAVREACNKQIPSGNLAQTSLLYAKLISFILNVRQREQFPAWCRLPSTHWSIRTSGGGCQHLQIES